MAADRARVLLIEDNLADAHLVEEAVGEAAVDCDLSILHDGAQAIALIDRLDSGETNDRPDLVILDLNLPKIGGQAVLERLRRSPVCGGTKVLVMSSSDAPHDRQRAMELGANDYFRKPSSLDQFMALGPKIQAMLQGPCE